MCIKDSINKTCNKTKICQTGLLKLNFETSPKKRIFRFLPKISAGHGWSWKFFFANFQILGPLGCQGWVVIPQNVKKSQNHCTLTCILPPLPPSYPLNKPRSLLGRRHKWWPLFFLPPGCPPPPLRSQVTLLLRNLQGSSRLPPILGWEWQWCTEDTSLTIFYFKVFLRDLHCKPSLIYKFPQSFSIGSIPHCPNCGRRFTPGRAHSKNAK